MATLCRDIAPVDFARLDSGSSPALEPVRGDVLPDSRCNGPRVGAEEVEATWKFYDAILSEAIAGRPSKRRPIGRE